MTIVCDYGWMAAIWQYWGGSSVFRWGKCSFFCLRPCPPKCLCTALGIGRNGQPRQSCSSPGGTKPSLGPAAALSRR